MAKQDYYQTLGVAKAGSEKEIRQAYRRLARKHHPDLNPGDTAAEQRFKQIQAAYDVLSDKENREKYDRFGPEFERFEAGAASGEPQYGFNWSPGGRQERVDFSAIFGDDVIGSVFGGGRGGGVRGGRVQRRGEDIEHAVEVTLEEAYAGTTRTLQLQAPDGSLKTLEVKLPAGVASGSRVRVAAQGGQGVNGGSPGDLFLIVTVRPHQTFERKGDDLFAQAATPLYTAILGGEVQVPTPRGTRLALKVPAESQNGQRFRLAGQGMPHLTGGGRGDLYAELNVQLPRHLSGREQELFQELASAREEVGA